MGRPKLKNVPRYANGRAKPTPPPARLLRLLGLVSSDKWIIAMGSSVSRLAVVDQYLTGQEADAAAYYAIAEQAYRVGVGLPSQNPRAQDLNALGGYSDGVSTATARKMCGRYNALRNALDHEQIITLDRHVVQDIWPGWWERPALKAALARVVKITT